MDDVGADAVEASKMADISDIEVDEEALDAGSILREHVVFRVMYFLKNQCVLLSLVHGREFSLRRYVVIIALGMCGSMIRESSCCALGAFTRQVKRILVLKRAEHISTDLALVALQTLKMLQVPLVRPGWPAMSMLLMHPS